MEQRLYPTLKLFEVYPFAFDHEEGVCILGLALGSKKYHDKYFSHLVDDCGKFLKLLPDLKDAQVALELMRACFSVTKVMHAMRGAPAGNIVEATAQLYDEVREAFGKIFHFDPNDAMMEELTLPNKGKNVDAKDATLGIGLTSFRNTASSAHLAALIDASELREQMMQDVRIGDEIRGEVEETIKKVCKLWAEQANLTATSIDEVLKGCALKQKPDPTKCPAKTQARLSQMVIGNRINAVRARVPKFKQNYSIVDQLHEEMQQQKEKQWLICSISNADCQSMDIGVFCARMGFQCAKPWLIERKRCWSKDCLGNTDALGDHMLKCGYQMGNCNNPKYVRDHRVIIILVH